MIAPKTRAVEESKAAAAAAEAREVDLKQKQGTNAQQQQNGYKTKARAKGEWTQAEAREEIAQKLFRVIPLQYGPRELPSTTADADPSSASGKGLPNGFHPASSASSSSPSSPASQRSRRPGAGNGRGKSKGKGKGKRALAAWTADMVLMDEDIYALASAAFPGGSGQNVPPRCSVTKYPCPAGSIPRAPGAKGAMMPAGDSDDEDGSGGEEGGAKERRTEYRLARRRRRAERAARQAAREDAGSGAGQEEESEESSSDEDDSELEDDAGDALATSLNALGVNGGAASSSDAQHSADFDAASTGTGTTEEESSSGAEAHSDLPRRPTTGASFHTGRGYMLTRDSRGDVGTWWPKKHVWLGENVRRQLGLRDYDLVLLSPPSPAMSLGAASSSPPPPPDVLDYHRLALREYEEEQRAKREEAEAEERAKVSLAKGKGKEVADGSAPPSAPPTRSAKRKSRQRRVAGVDKQLEKATGLIRDSFRARQVFGWASIQYGGRENPHIPYGMLITGSPGSGKTAVVREVVRSVCYPDYLDPGEELLTGHFIDCSAFSEERVPLLRAQFDAWLAAAAWTCPSVLVLENVDRICPAEQEHADGSRQRQLAHNLVSRVTRMCQEWRIFVVMTAQSTTGIHAVLNASHIFVETIQLKAPNKDGRRDILDLVVRKKLRTRRPLRKRGLNFVTLSNSCEGYLPADLQDLTDRAIHCAAIRNVDTGSMTLEMQDFTKAQEGFTPMSLRDVKLQKSDVAWSDIGGLMETRQVLRETLEWPTKYAAIFANCPLRLRSGLLLYGYPGCGKTLLASAVAKECGLNFISVKGPEILNKYIGASEKSVRDLFDRAQAAKPCVLFFDEFDSIAPKRGHDSTGVTDRVVNQLLTQMDGAEGLDGVYVLAATSRPDLIDSALLRPGRLDKSLLCDMPDEESRLDIMRAVANKVKLDDSVDLTYWAKQTQGFSGADLQALLYNAHLETIHETIAAERDSGAEGQTGGDKKDKSKDLTQSIKVFTYPEERTSLSGAQKQEQLRRYALIVENDAKQRGIQRQSDSASDAAAEVQAASEAAGKKKEHRVLDRHLQKSIKSTRPSVPAAEVRRLQRIYDEFAGKRSGTFPMEKQACRLARESRSCRGRANQTGRITTRTALRRQAAILGGAYSDVNGSCSVGCNQFRSSYLSSPSIMWKV